MTCRDAILRTACVTLTAATTTASAEQLVHIDFGPSFGAPDDVMILTSQLAEHGVLFSAPTTLFVWWFGESGQAAYPWSIHPGLLPGYPSSGDPEPIHIEFLVPVRSVAIRGLDGGGNVDTMILRAFDADGVMIDEQMITSNFAVPGHVLEVRGDIAEVVVCATGSTAGLFFDDLTFVRTDPCVPGAGSDCNANGTPDECEIEQSDDVFDNGLPDWTLGPSVGDSMIANRFVSGSDDLVNRIRFRFAELSPDADLGPSVQWSILADVAGTPGGTLFAGIDLNPHVEQIGEGPDGTRWYEGTIDPGPVLLLQAGTAYWLGLHAGGATDAAAVRWSASVSAPAESAVLADETDAGWLPVGLDGVSFKLDRMLHDCNANGIPDECDIADGTSADVNADGLPDECQALCPEDVDGSGEIGFSDLLAVIAAWGPCPGCPADLNDNGFADFGDVLLILAAWGDCVQ